MKKKDSYLITKDVAKLTGLAYSTVKNYCRTGKIKALKIGNRYVVAIDEVMNIIQNGARKQKSIHLEKAIDSKTKQGLLFPESTDELIEVDNDNSNTKKIRTIKSLLCEISEDLKKIVEVIAKERK